MLLYLGAQLLAGTASLGNLPRWRKTVGAIVVVSFASFIALSIVVGEHAICGSYDGDKYFVCARSTDPSHEVSGFVWHLSYALGVVTYLSFGFSAILALIDLARRPKKR